MDDISRLQQLNQSYIIVSVKIANASDALSAASQDGQGGMVHLMAAADLLETDHKNADWKVALSNIKHRARSVAALEDVVSSLETAFRTRVITPAADYEDAIEYACTGRRLLDINRVLAYKVR